MWKLQNTRVGGAGGRAGQRGSGRAGAACVWPGMRMAAWEGWDPPQTRPRGRTRGSEPGRRGLGAPAWVRILLSLIEWLSRPSVSCVYTGDSDVPTQSGRHLAAPLFPSQMPPPGSGPLGSSRWLQVSSLLPTSAPSPVTHPPCLGCAPCRLRQPHRTESPPLEASFAPAQPSPWASLPSADTQSLGLLSAPLPTPRFIL